ncbi:MAG: hypothetical protein LBP89_01510 [Helicobacteraceae bacterium]|jgi:alpha-tubulin suppressor-like RCC1 family protein|nr:hypothetical protein [Helicobacteraceae bacterium]
MKSYFFSRFNPLRLFGAIYLAFALASCAQQSAQIKPTAPDKQSAPKQNASEMRPPETKSDENLSAIDETPVKAAPIDVIKKFALGEKHTLILDDKGRIWASGNDDRGQLGLNGKKTASAQEVSHTFSLASIASDKAITDIAAGYDQSFAIDSEGDVWASGANDQGQLGLGDLVDRVAFTKVLSLKNKNIVAIASGASHVLALDSEGGVWASGANSLGQLGIGSNSLKSEFVKVSDLGDKKIVAIGAGRYHSIALDNEGGVWTSGGNYYGQLGLASSGSASLRNSFVKAPINGKIVAIGAGDIFSAALDDAGRIWTSGYNRHGQLGLGDTIDRDAFTRISGGKFVSIAVGGAHILALNNEGKVWASGANNFGQLGAGNFGSQTNRDSLVQATQLIGDRNIVAIVSGGGHNVAIDSEGGVWINGSNRFNQLGLATGGVLSAFSDALRLNADYADRSLKQFARDDAQPNISDRNLTAIAVGDSHTIALDSEGKVWASGFNEYGQLGLSDPDNQRGFVEITDLSDKSIVAISAGDQHTIALGANGKVWASGFNGYEQLGLNDAENRTGFVEIKDLSDKNISALSAGGYHSFAIDDAGRVWASGRNNRGQLGVGDSYNRAAFSETPNLKNKTIVAMAEGKYHSFAIDDAGRVWASGLNDEGQLGLGATNNRTTFTEVTSFKGRFIVAIAAGEAHSIALDNEGGVWTSGANDYGQLGLGDRTGRLRFTQVLGLAGKKIAAIGAGARFSIAASDDGTIWATGWNDKGQLGLGDTLDRAKFAKVANFKGGVIAAIGGGEKHTILLDTNGRIWTSGYNYYGQLGLDDALDRTEFFSLEPATPQDETFQDDWSAYDVTGIAAP